MNSCPESAIVFSISQDKFLCTQPFQKIKIFLLFFLFFLLNFGGGVVWGQNPADSIPSYEWIDAEELPTVSITALNTEDLTIAVATGPDDFVYTLSFGNGVAKRAPDGTLIKANFITGLESPLDIAIDSKGLIYIADYSEDGTCFQNGKVKIFSPSGNLLRIQYTDFYIPTGLALDDDDNLYVTEFNPQRERACENDQMSRLSVYRSDRTIIRNGNDVNQPFRVAVDSQKNVYVSQGGINDPAVLIFDENLVLKGELPNIQSPGSIVVDEFDYIHVVEYAGKIDFSQLLDFANIGVSEAINFSHKIFHGIEDSSFGVKIYDSNRVLKDFFKDEVDFPIDIAFNNCDRMYLLNSTVIPLVHYDNIFGHEFIPAELQTDLEIYERSPSFDSAEDPKIICLENIEVTAEAGKDYAIVEFDDATATDNCSAIIEQTDGEPSGSEFTVGDHLIEFTATDEFGNTDDCTFTITVHPSEEVEVTKPVFQNCPTENIEVITEEGICGAVVNFSTPTASDENGEVEVELVSEYASGEIFPIGSTTVTFEATNAADTSTCSFEVIVTDNEAPKKINCSENLHFTIPYGETQRKVEYEIPTFSDNCTSLNVERIEGPASGEFFEVGETTVNYEATDGYSTTSCSFTVTIENEKLEAPVFENCPPDNINITSDEGICGAVVTFSTPTASDENGEVEVDLVSDYASGEIFPVGTTTVTFEVTNDADTATCSFDVIVTDETAPLLLSCLSDQFETLTAGEFVVPDYRPEVTFSDNCSTNLTLEQIPQPGTTITQTTEVSIIATDEAGNESAACEFSIMISETTPPKTYECLQTTAIDEELNENCGVILEDYTHLVGNFENFENGSNVTQSPASGTTINEDTEIILTIKDGTEVVGTCSFEVTVSDETAPVLQSCLSDQFETLTAGEFVVPDYRPEVTFSDNCSTNLTLEQIPQPGTTITQTTEVSIIATDEAGNESAACEFSIMISETTPPKTYECLQTTAINEELNENCEVILEDYTYLVGNFENFENGSNVTQSPAPGTTIRGDAEITLTIKDGTEVVGTCEFDIVVSDRTAPEFECPDTVLINQNDQGKYILPDFGYLATDSCDEDLTIVQDPPPGEITADTMVRITATDDAGNEAVCTINVEVGSAGPPDFECVEAVTLQLDGTGTADLFVEDLYTGNATGVNFELEKSYFTCEDLGNQPVTLNYSGARTGSCQIMVSVKDTIAPVIIPEDISVPIAENGSVTITAEDIGSYSVDNCGIQSMSLSKYEFGCSELGVNEVTLTAEDTSGNISTQEVTVTVIDPSYFCSGIPVEPPLEPFFVIIYPNPSEGVVFIETSIDVAIDKVQVFDMRGRYLMEKVFPEFSGEYFVDLSHLQSAVYVLKLFIADEIYVKQAIIRND